jgi:phosphoesterase RecJ-like protein
MEKRRARLEKRPAGMNKEPARMEKGARLAPDVAAFLRQHARFVLTTHVNPDGDGLGSEMGLYHILRQLGKEVTVLNQDEILPKYRFLDPEGVIRSYGKEGNGRAVAEADGIVVLDVSRFERLGPFAGVVRASSAQKIVIDHHPPDGDVFDFSYVNVDACATGELVFTLAGMLGVTLTREIALPLYVSIVTDTGSFRFTNSDPRAHRVAARLLETGIDPSDVFERLFGNSSPERMRLLGRALASIELRAAGRLSVVRITQAMLAETGARAPDAEGFIDTARSIESVEACALFVELPRDRVKASLRSRSSLDVNRIAGRFGGGGHVRASGILLDGAFEETVEKVVLEIERELLLLFGPPGSSAPPPGEGPPA